MIVGIERQRLLKRGSDVLLSSLILLGLAPVGYVLAFGKFGFPEMGAGGLGIASALTMWLQAIAFAIYLSRSKRFADLHLFAHFDPPRRGPIMQLLRTGLPIGITVLMEGSLFIVTALLIARLGATPAAAHQIAINVSALCFMIPMGVAEATTVRVGHAVGAGNTLGIRRAAHAGYVIVLTTLTEPSAASIMEFYRRRWQIELAFKRLKSLLQLGHLKKFDKEGARAWLQGKLLVACLIEKLILTAERFSPWGYATQDGSSAAAALAVA